MTPDEIVWMQEVRSELDILAFRQRFAKLMEIFGFDYQVRTRASTAISEVLRRCFREVGRLKLRILARSDQGDALVVEFELGKTDHLDALLEPGREFIDDVQVHHHETSARVELSVFFPAGKRTLDLPRALSEFGRWVRQIPRSPLEALSQHNQEILLLMRDLQTRQEELVRVNHEMQETNSGVVAMYVDLDSKLARLQRLNDATMLLFESLNSDVSLNHLADFVVPALADWCVIFVQDRELVSGAGLSAITYSNPEEAWIAQAFKRRFDSGITRALCSAKVLEQGKTELVAELDQSHLKKVIVDSEHETLLNAMSVASMVSVPLLKNGAPIGFLSLASSRSERKFSEDDLLMVSELGKRIVSALERARLYRQALAAISAREEFLMLASHELKTPLTTLSLGIQLIKRTVTTSGECGGKCAEQLLNLSTRVEKEATALGSMINELLDFARTRADVIALNRVSVDPGELIRGVIDRLGPQIASSGSEVKVSSQVQLVAFWDRGRIEQVIANLLLNALKFGRGKPVDISLTKDDAGVMIAIADHGQGIPPDVIPTLFQPFERGRVSAQYVAGLGLGLYIVRRFAEAHGGKVDVESRQGVGSVFKVRIPLGQMAETEQAA